MNDVNVHFLFTAIPVNYISELMECFEATTYTISLFFPFAYDVCNAAEIKTLMCSRSASEV